MVIRAVRTEADYANKTPARRACILLLLLIYMPPWENALRPKNKFRVWVSPSSSVRAPKRLDPFPPSPRRHAVSSDPHSGRKGRTWRTRLFLSILHIVTTAAVVHFSRERTWLQGDWSASARPEFGRNNNVRAPHLHHRLRGPATIVS